MTNTLASGAAGIVPWHRLAPGAAFAQQRRRFPAAAVPVIAPKAMATILHEPLLQQIPRNDAAGPLVPWEFRRPVPRHGRRSTKGKPAPAPHRFRTNSTDIAASAEVAAAPDWRRAA